MNLSNKVCLVTGGTKGIGAATARMLAGKGAQLALAARNLDADARALCQQIESSGTRCLLIQADLGKGEDATRAVAETIAAFGRVDVVIHSAGGAVNGGLFDVTPEVWQAAFDVHVTAVYHLCRAAIPDMRKRKEGSIILISSAAGIRGIKTNVAYQAVKGALPQLTRAIAYEFAADNIRVNCVAPGVIRTDFHRHMTPEAKQHNLDNRIPLKREGTSEQVASAIVEMATNDYITGETLVVDGGLTMRIC